MTNVDEKLEELSNSELLTKERDDAIKDAVTLRKALYIMFEYFVNQNPDSKEEIINMCIDMARMEE